MNETRKVTRLRARVDEARELRKLRVDPSAAALTVERINTMCAALLWVSVIGFSGFTMVNVQKFFAGDAKPWSAEWTTAWLIDPMFVAALLAALLAEQVMASYQIRSHWSVTLLKWVSLLATYVLNTWHSWALGDAEGVVKHSAAPVIVFVIAEAMPWIRDRLTQAVFKAAGLLRSNEAEQVAPGVATPVATEQSTVAIAPTTAPAVAPVATGVAPEQSTVATAPEAATPEQSAPEQVAPEVATPVAPASDLVGLAEQVEQSTVVIATPVAPEVAPEQSTGAVAPEVATPVATPAVAEQVEQSNGAVRSNVTDIAATAERDAKLFEIFERYPELSAQKTADLMAELHGLTVGRSTVDKIKRRWKIAKSA